MQLRISSKAVASAVILWVFIYLAAYIYYINSETHDENGLPNLTLQQLLNMDTSISGIRAQMLSIVRRSGERIDGVSGSITPSIRVGPVQMTKADSTPIKSAYDRGSDKAAAQVEIALAKAAATASASSTLPKLTYNPFVSEVCTASIQANLSGSAKGNVLPQSVAIIIPTRNEQPEMLLHTITSVFSNSGEELKAVVVVDDCSDTKVKDWPVWESEAGKVLQGLMSGKCLGGNTKQCLRIVRPKSRLGVSGAKNFGARIFTVAQEADHFHDKSVTTLVFLDGHVVVSPQWLLPLASSLSANPNAIVYPAIDVIDPASGGFIKVRMLPTNALPFILHFAFASLHV